VESSDARRLRQDYATACYGARLNGYRPFSGDSSELLDKSGLNGRIVSLDNEVRGTKRSCGVRTNGFRVKTQMVHERRNYTVAVQLAKVWNQRLCWSVRCRSNEVQSEDFGQTTVSNEVCVNSGISRPFHGEMGQMHKCQANV
jgi:hypothetical protein